MLVNLSGPALQGTFNRMLIWAVINQMVPHYFTAGGVDKSAKRIWALLKSPISVNLFGASLVLQIAPQGYGDAPVRLHGIRARSMTTLRRSPLHRESTRLSSL